MLGKLFPRGGSKFERVLNLLNCALAHECYSIIQLPLHDTSEQRSCGCVPDVVVEFGSEFEKELVDGACLVVVLFYKKNF